MTLDGLPAPGSQFLERVNLCPLVSALHKCKPANVGPTALSSPPLSGSHTPGHSPPALITQDQVPAMRGGPSAPEAAETIHTSQSCTCRRCPTHFFLQKPQAWPPAPDLLTCPGASPVALLWWGTPPPLGI